ncbi:hypothetical protein Tco_1538625 [Tanacetum coccineum]
MCTYLKNIEGKKPKDLKNKSFDSIQKMFDRAFKRMNTFVDFRTNLVEGVDDVQETAEVDDDQETTKIKELMKIVSDEEEVAIDAIPLATKPPTIVDWKIHKEGKKNYYQIIRADGSSKMYLVFSHMLKSFDREDFKTLWKLGDLKTMFEPHVEDRVWKNQQDYRVLEWKLYDSCGVHFLRMQHMQIYMLVEKRYPLTPATITDMLNKKLQWRIVGIKRLLDDLRVTAAQERALFYSEGRLHILLSFCQFAFEMLYLPDGGEHPSRTFSLCSAVCRGTPVISASFQANTLSLRLSKSYNAFRPSSVRVEPTVIVCSG